MSRPTRLVTSADLGDEVDHRRMSVKLRHEVELADGRRVLLLDDRGWDGSGAVGIWARTSVEDVVATARVVVGPDEPFEDRSFEDMAADHWAHLRDVLSGHGVATDPLELRQLPQDVVLSERLRARLGHE